MTPAVLRRSLSAVLALATAVVVPVLTTGGGPASAKPEPVSAKIRTYGFSAQHAPAARVAPGPDSGTAARAAAADEARSEAVDLGGVAHVVGVTWDRGAVATGTTVQLREERDGVWGAWEDLVADSDEGPDAGTEEAQGSRGGTAPWVSTADAVQTRVVGDTESHGTAARFDVVDATTTAADRSMTSTPAGAASAAATQPTIYTRADWGADESLRRSSVNYGTVKAAVVHHTDGSNDYTASQVPSIIRGIYAFHVNGRGWNDIGYNFLVDKFGRTWEGRYGGITQPIVGAHALGVNSETSGVSVLGDFTSSAPSDAAVTAVEKLVAWRLGLVRVDPTATTYLSGKGTFPTVIGHRDVYSTSCPGAYLYALLGTIRSRAHAYQGTMVYSPSISRTSYGYGGGGVTVRGSASRSLTWRLTVTSVCHDDADVTLTGSANGSFAAAWNGRLPDGSLAPPGNYHVDVAASTGSGTRANDPGLRWLVRIGDTSSAPAKFCPPRLSGANRYGVAVATARATDRSTKKVVIVNGTSHGMADALVAAPYARKLGAVLLLTRADSLPSETRSELRRRGATSAVVVGGPASVGSGVTGELADLGLSWKRVGGDTRYDVAANVARLMAGSGSTADVLVASGEDRAMADGLVLSAPAVALRRPVLLVRSDSVPAPTRQALTDVHAARAVVAGGPVTVQDAVVADLPAATRIGGASRYALSANIAKWAVRKGVSEASVLASSGETRALADTLSGGQLGRPTVYVKKDAVPSSVAGWLRNADALSEVTVLGGTASVTLTTGGAVQSAVPR